MKVSSFKKFLEEEDSKAIVQTGLNSKSIDNSVTKEIINSRLANTTSNPFLTPYIALGSIARILAYVNIVVPQYTFLDRDEGEVVFDATQVGQIAGVNIDGSPARSEADHFIYFSYSMNDDGYYDCFAALVDSDELEDIMDIGGDEDVDQFDVDQKVNEVADPDDSFARISYGSKPGNVYYHKKSNTYFATSLGGSKKQFRNEKQAKKHANLDDREMNDKNEELKVNQHKFGVDQKVNEEIHSPGTKVRVPHKGKMTSGKVVRHDKGDPHGSPFYVVDVGEDASAKIPAHEVQVDMDETFVNQSRGRLRGSPLGRHMQTRDARLNQATQQQIRGEELKGDQYKLDVAEPKGKLTSADFKKLRGEERDKLKEAMKHDETSHATLPAMEQDSPEDHDEAAKWHDEMARQARSFSNNSNLKFHVERGAHHRTQAAAMRSQGMGKQVDEQSINERKSSDPKGLAYKVTAASHAANPEWGPADHTQDPKKHFPTAATRDSTLAVIKAIRSHIKLYGRFDVNNPDHVDAAAKAVHGSPQDYEGKPIGWSQAAMTHPGQSPEQKERRAKLTGPYHSLSDAEKEKDRQIVRTVAANMRTKPTNPATRAAEALRKSIAAHQASRSQSVRKPAVASSSKSEPSIEDAAKRVKAAPQNPAAQELKARIAAHQQTKKK